MSLSRSRWMPRLLAVSALSALPLVASAQSPGAQMSPEEMQQYMQQRGYGPAYGMGPGMMGGGYGPGMGMGPGMMGPGMMGPGMMGPGMMGMGPLGMLDLTDEQRDKIETIFDSERKKHWELMGKIMDEQAKLRDLYQADEPDPKKVGSVYESISKLRRQMVESHVQTRNEIQKLLTKEQRDQLKQWRRGGWGRGYGPHGGYGPGMGMGPGMMGR